MLSAIRPFQLRSMPPYTGKSVVHVQFSDFLQSECLKRTFWGLVFGRGMGSEIVGGKGGNGGTGDRGPGTRDRENLEP